ncbi:hypothetical protein [Yoonia sp. R2-816]|uniref:hypothetical protein n=1 Tax=Yoonia sp. R2-816 TaxID=3342638 RepID=UPI00372B28AC
MSRKKILVYSAIVAATLATNAYAQLSERTVPAQCQMRQACDGGICVDVSVPFRPLFFFQNEGRYSYTSTFGNAPFAISDFPNVDAAQRSYSANTEAVSPYFIVPKGETGIGYNLDLHTVFDWREKTHSFGRYVKLSCRFIHPAMDFY